MHLNFRLQAVRYTHCNIVGDGSSQWAVEAKIAGILDGVSTERHDLVSPCSDSGLFFSCEFGEGYGDCSMKSTLDQKTSQKAGPAIIVRCGGSDDESKAKDEDRVGLTSVCTEIQSNPNDPASILITSLGQVRELLLNLNNHPEPDVNPSSTSTNTFTSTSSTTPSASPWSSFLSSSWPSSPRVPSDVDMSMTHVWLDSCSSSTKEDNEPHSGSPPPISTSESLPIQSVELVPVVPIGSGSDAVAHATYATHFSFAPSLAPILSAIGVDPTILQLRTQLAKANDEDRQRSEERTQAKCGHEKCMERFLRLKEAEKTATAKVTLLEARLELQKEKTNAVEAKLAKEKQDVEHYQKLEKQARGRSTLLFNKFQVATNKVNEQEKQLEVVQKQLDEVTADKQRMESKISELQTAAAVQSDKIIMLRWNVKEKEEDLEEFREKWAKMDDVFKFWWTSDKPKDT
ncbi:hypothetical protein D9758_004942 [Tetrapyrgos nigripes]|uniref:Uncharacterized protein n=1 Tax=Tetrapyrgos nigripes TaxID=182062 RepID=A0A8H5GW37_9AGAR|nr:hypothetical protein D9758_004942 [Tetrapyrgos nigripes]